MDDNSIVALDHPVNKMTKTSTITRPPPPSPFLSSQKTLSKKARLLIAHDAITPSSAFIQCSSAPHYDHTATYNFVLYYYCKTSNHYSTYSTKGRNTRETCSTGKLAIKLILSLVMPSHSRRQHSSTAPHRTSRKEGKSQKGPGPFPC